MRNSSLRAFLPFAFAFMESVNTRKMENIIFSCRYRMERKKYDNYMIFFIRDLWQNLRRIFLTFPI